MQTTVEIDGSFGEGGGQIVRIALSLAAIVGKKVEVKNIRVKRPNPGLRPQHLTALQAIAHISGGVIEGLTVGSKRVTYSPGEALAKERIDINVGTAGSIPLIIQCILPALVFSKSRSVVKIVGGTDVKWSPTIDYVKHVFFPNLRMFGVKADLAVVKRGYYPRGGGVVDLTVKPAKKLKSVNFVREKLEEIEVISVCSNLPRHVAERQAKSALNELRKKGIKSANVKIVVNPREKAVGRGTSILVKGVTESNVVCGGDAIGERGKPAEKVGSEAALKFLEWYESKASVDIYLGDMLIPYASLAQGETTYTVQKETGHIISSLYVEERILGAKYRVKKIEEELYRISINGVGFENKFI